MTDHAPRPSRTRADLDGPTPPAGSPVRDPFRRVEGEPAVPVDLDRLRTQAASALAAERAAAPPVATVPADVRAPATKRSLRSVALPTLCATALLTVGLVVLTRDPASGDDVAVPGSPVGVTTAVVDTTGAPSTPATTPTTASPTTVSPTTAPAPAAAAGPDAGPPPHRATYRAGKLYLEGRVSSAEEGRRYVEKAAAVLGPDNVVDTYTVDPSVPPSVDGTVYVDEPFLFATGSAELDPAYTGVLGLGIAALRLNPGARMVVTGYTDDRGDPARNQELSLARALAVVDHMVIVGGIDRSRFDAIGAGDRDPVADNATEEGRRLNRRIDVRFVGLLG